MKKRDKKITWTIIILIVLVIFSINIYNNHKEAIGGERDEHGCLTPAGYSYNETLGVCLREWEIKGINRMILEQTTTLEYEYGLTIDSIVVDDNCAECYKIGLDILGNKRNMGIELSQERQYCSEPRKTDAYCITVYEPVCGVDASGELNTFSNSCFACLNESVEYYFVGEC